MNEKTARLIKNYASATKKNEKELKRWWNQMNKDERTKARKELEKKVAEDK